MWTWAVTLAYASEHPDRQDEAPALVIIPRRGFCLEGVPKGLDQIDTSDII